MPLQQGPSNSSAIFAALVPRMSYAQLAQSKQQEAQYATILAERERLQTQQQQQELMLVQEKMNQLRSLPFEAPDQERIKQWIKSRERENAERIEKEYGGDVQKFIQSEGRMWLQQTTGDLLSSDIFKVAERNKQNIALYKEAASKGNNIIGEWDGTNYKPAEQVILDFYNGKTPTFNFRGSYQPKTNIIDHFGKIDNPWGSRYDREATVSEEEKLNYLVQTLGPEAGRDMYLRSFKDIPVKYKTYSIEDQQKYIMDIMDTQSKINARETNEQLRERQIKAQEISAQAKLQKQQQEANLPDITTSILSNVISTTDEIPYKERNKVIPQFGVSVADLTVKGPDGKPQLRFDMISDLTLGDKVDELAGLRRKAGGLKQVLLDKEGGDVIDLSKTKHGIVDILPGIYIDHGQKLKMTQTGKITPDRVFRKAIVQLKQEEAEKVGIMKGKNLLAKEAGVLNYNKDKDLYYVNLEVMIPVQGSVFNLPELKNIINKGQYGQKESNAIAGERAEAGGDWQTIYDDIVD